MSDKSPASPKVEQPTVAPKEASTTEAVAPAIENKPAESSAETGVEPTKPAEVSTTESASVEPADQAGAKLTDAPDAAKPVTDAPSTEEKPGEEKATETQTTENSTAADSAAIPTSATPSNKTKAARRSSGVPAGKKLNKKASKAKITHLDAKPGDHFFARLKGYPPWPVIIADEEMLPAQMINSRPVTALRPDGTYRDDYADGGKKAQDRTYAVMYLYTNEFGWTPNTDLNELDPETVLELKTPKMRKDLQQAHDLAAEHHDIDYYKNILLEHEQQRIEAEEQKKAKAAAKAATPKKAAKKQAAEGDEAEDVEMADADGDEEKAEKKSKNKKRKAEGDAETPARSDSVKKPKIKLTTSTPKAANGTPTPKSGKDAATKPVKVKTSKAKADSEKKADTPKEVELSPEEKRIRKEKEILFLRHRLQKGLLNRDQEPKADEMEPLSNYLSKLETFPDLEVSIIRATKINKVLKAILKLDSIPKEEEFKFKPRSQTLLDKWNKLLATDAAPNSAAPTGPTNGVNGDTSVAKTEKEATNGVKTNGESTPKEEAKLESKAEETKPEPANEDTNEAPPAVEAAA